MLSNTTTMSEYCLNCRILTYAAANKAASAPGAAEHLHGGFVVYTEEAKRNVLGVPVEILERDGIVSEAVARSLAERALSCSAADISVGITGVAGPATDDEGNPVGLVHIAAARRGFPTLQVERRFGDLGRNEVRSRSVMEALALLERIALAKTVEE